jgi:hypothetical protein
LLIASAAVAEIMEIQRLVHAAQLPTPPPDAPNDIYGYNYGEDTIMSEAKWSESAMTTTAVALHSAPVSPIAQSEEPSPPPTRNGKPVVEDFHKVKILGYVRAFVSKWLSWRGYAEADEGGMLA